MAGGALNLDTALLYIADALETITGIEPLGDASETRAGRIARIEHIADIATEIAGGGGGGATAWGGITGTLSAQTDLQSALDAKQAAGSYLTAASLTPYALTSALTAGLDTKQPVGDYATSSSLTAGLATKEATGVAAGLIAALTKASVGLANVDNTSDVDKPVSTATTTALNLKAPLASPTFTGTVGGVTAAMVGLGNVTNTSDANKPVSTAQQTALDLKAPIASPTFTGTVGGITASMVGLGNVTNTSDANKPVSTAQQTALDLKANLASPAFTGTPTGITATHVGLGNVTNIAQTSVTGLTGTQSVAAFKTGLSLVKGDVGLGNADNTSDANKPVSTAQQTALDLKLSIAAAAAGYQPLDTQLTDLAALVYTANALKVLRVNAGATGFEVATLAGGGDMLAALNLADLLSASVARTNLGVPATTRSIATTAPLTGGGDLSADRTLAISAATTGAAGSMSAVDKAKVDNQLAPVTGLAGAIGPAIADYFTSTISLEASSIYEIEAHAYFLKTTAGTLVWTWLFSSAPTVAQSSWAAGPITGFTTALVNGTELYGHAVQEASTTLAHAASGSLTTAVRHSFRLRARIRTNAATTIQLRATSSAGTVTPQAGSYMRARKIA